MSEEILKTFRIDGAATGKDDTLLLFEELVVIGAGNLLYNRGTTQNMFIDNLWHQISGNKIVSNRFFTRHTDVDEHIIRTQATAASRTDVTGAADLGCNTLFFKFFFKGCDNSGCAGGKTTGACTNKNFQVFSSFGHRSFLDTLAVS